MALISLDEILNVQILIGSLGIMIIGNNFIVNNLNTLVTPAFQRLDQKWLHNSLFICIWGVLFGLLLQNQTTIFFITASMVAYDKFPLRYALLLMAYSYVGVGLSIFNLAFSSKKLAFILLAIAGFGLFIRAGGKWPSVRNCILGYGLLYLGQQLMLPAVNDLQDADFIKFIFHQQPSLFAFGLIWLIGLLFALLLSMSSTIFLLIGFALSGALSMEQCIFIICGSMVGIRINTNLIAHTTPKGQLHEEATRLGRFYLAFTIFISLLFCFIALIEFKTQIPLIKSLIQKVTSNLQFQILLIYNFFIIFSCIVTTLFLDPIQNLIEAWLPKKTVPEDPSQAKYLTNTVLDNPTVALEMLERENLRCLGFLGNYTVGCREYKIQKKTKPKIFLSQEHAQFHKISHQIDAFRQQLFNKELQPVEARHFIKLGDQTSLIRSLEESTYHLSQTIFRCREDIFNELIEYLLATQDELLQMTIAMLEELGKKDAEKIERIIHDREMLFDEFLHKYFDKIDQTDESDLFVILDLAKRIFWFYAKLVSDAQPDNENTTV